MDLMMTCLQLVKNGFSVRDLDEMALFEFEMFVIVVVADKERRIAEEVP